MDDDLDDILDSIFQVIDLRDPRLKDKLRRGLQKGLEVAGELGHDVKVELDLDGATPEVVVLDGGRKEGSAAPDPTGPPDLSVIDGDGRGPDIDFLDGDLEDDDLLDESMRVRVIRSGSTGTRTAGQIEVADDLQTVYRGQTARTYRLHCDGGGLTVLLDGEEVDGIIGGQSIDVEAGLIQVRGDGEGWYVAVHV
jgi:hypothetical protein